MNVFPAAFIQEITSFIIPYLKALEMFFKSACFPLRAAAKRGICMGF
jgi:hypothetical protein